MQTNEGKPAKFLLYNSKGHPDFIMTMLVVMILALFLVVLFWMLLNIMALRMTGSTGNVQLSQFIMSFNENARLIVLGICSSVFSLAGAYYLRRASFDKHYAVLKEVKAKFGMAKDDDAKAATFAEAEVSTLSHQNYDDEEEDI